MSQHILERGSGHLPLDLIFDQVGYTTIILLSFFILEIVTDIWHRLDWQTLHIVSYESSAVRFKFTENV
jgi:hypothetical protein